jgi:hypothetical protein
MLQLCNREPLPVKVRNRLYSERSMHTDRQASVPIWRDVKGSRPDGACEVCRVGRHFYGHFMLYHILRTTKWFAKGTI